MAMFGYMTDLDHVEITQIYQVEAEGHDLQSLLFHFLDELLFMFSAEPYIVAKVLFTFHKIFEQQCVVNTHCFYYRNIN